MLGAGAAAGALFLPNFESLTRRASVAIETQTGLQVELFDKLHVLQGAGGNITLLHGPDGTFQFDSDLPDTAAAVFKASQQFGPTKLLVNTHWHYDHVGGNETFGKTGVLIASHENTLRRLSTTQNLEAFKTVVPPYAKPAWPIVTFDQHLNLQGNGEEIHLHHIENAHTDTDVIAHLPGLNVVVTGDLYFNGVYPFVDYSSKGWLGGMIAGIDRVLKLTDAKTKVIPGHGAISNAKELKANRDVLEKIYLTISK